MHVLNHTVHLKTDRDLYGLKLAVDSLFVADLDAEVFRASGLPFTSQIAPVIESVAVTLFN